MNEAGNNYSYPLKSVITVTIVISASFLLSLSNMSPLPKSLMASEAITAIQKFKLRSWVLKVYI